MRFRKWKIPLSYKFKLISYVWPILSLFAAEGRSFRRSVTYNVPFQLTFLACVPLPGRINIIVNVYMRTALRATVSLTLLWLPCFPSFSFFFFFRTNYGEFPSPFLTFSAPAVNRLVSPSFVSLIRPPLSYIIPSAGRGREISTYIHMCEMNVGRRCGRHFIKATGWRFSFCPAAAPAVAPFVRELKRRIPRH